MRNLTESEISYLKDLKWRCDHIKGDFERQVFDIVCGCFQSFKIGKCTSKHVPKETILRRLVLTGYLQSKPDGSLPDDRKVREAARNLLKAGLPILATSQNKGYYIAENPKEIDMPQKQNHKRAEKLLAVDKGYNEARAFLMGQGRLFD